MFTVDDDMQISALDVFYEMDGRMSRYIGEVLGWFREEDARDPKRSELIESIESMTCLSALKGKSEKSNQKIVTNEAFVKHFVMNARIDMKVVTQLLERHSASSDQHMKKWMSLREGLHVMLQ